jgi:hypothetical protein
LTYFFTPESLRAFATQAGFRVVQCVRVSTRLLNRADQLSLYRVFLQAILYKPLESGPDLEPNLTTPTPNGNENAARSSAAEEAEDEAFFARQPPVLIRKGIDELIATLIRYWAAAARCRGRACARGGRWTFISKLVKRLIHLS